MTQILSIKSTKPDKTVTLTDFAVVKLLLNTDVGITRLRGQQHEWWLGITLIPTFHPAAALRGGDRVTNQMREDFAVARSVLDSEAPDEEKVETAETEQMELFG